jgi:actin-related protein 2
MVGKEATQARSFLDLSYPVDQGVVKNWDDMTHVWNHGFNKMGVNTKECKILVTEPVFNSKQARIEMSQLLFEKY